MAVLLVLFTILVFFTLDFYATRRRQMAAEAVHADREVPILSEAMVPDGTYVSPGHVWVRPGPAGAIRIGIDRVLLSLLGGVENIYAQPEGAPVHLGGPLLMVRNGNRALQIRSPLDGVIGSVNPDAVHRPERVADDPLDGGWIYELKPQTSPGTIPALLSGEKAASWMQREFGRLRDLVLDLVPQPEGAPVLADGGLPLEGLGGHIAAQVEDEEWKGLVSRFFESEHRS